MPEILSQPNNPPPNKVAEELRKISNILGEQTRVPSFSNPIVSEVSKKARGMIGEVARNIATQIEEQLLATPKGDEQDQAYILTKVIVSEMIGSNPQVQYLLQTPQEVRKATGIEMVCITNGQSPYSQILSFADVGRGNPYLGSLRAFHLVSGNEQAKLLIDVARVAEDIERNGVKRDPSNFTFEIKSDKETPSDKLEIMRLALPFTRGLKPSSPEDIKTQTERATKEADANRIANQKIQEEQRKQFEATQEERDQKRRQEMIETTMGLITGKAPETARQTTPSPTDAVAYKPIVSLEGGTISFLVLRLPKGPQATPVPVIITLPLGKTDLTPENVLVERYGLENRGQTARQSIANMCSPYYSQLPEINSIFRELSSGTGVAMGTGWLANLQLVIGSNTINFAQASHEDQQRALAVIDQTAQKMNDRYTASPFTRALAELAQQPERTVEASVETLGLRTSIIQLLSGERVPEALNSKGGKPAIKSASVSLNHNEINLKFDAPPTPRDATARPGDSRNLQVTIPLGGRDFRPEDVLITFPGYRAISSLTEITDPALLRSIINYLEFALQGGITVPNMMDTITVSINRRNYGLASGYPNNASTEITEQVITLLKQQQPHYPSSPLNAAIEVALEAASQPDPKYGPYGFMKQNVEQLAGYTNNRGEIVPGTLLTTLVLDPELLATFGFWGNDVQAYAETIHGGKQPTPEQTEKAVAEIQSYLISRVLDLDKSKNDAGFDGSVLWLPNPDGYSLQRGVTPVQRTRFDDLDDFNMLRGRGGSLRVGGPDTEGNVPLRVNGRFVDILIIPTTAEEIVNEVYEFEIEEGGQIKHDADGHPIRHKVAGKGFRPAFKLTITEQTPSGEKETYSLYRVELGTQENSNQAILIQCSSPDSNAPTMYTSTMVTNHLVNVTRKPVIYLYPQKSQDVTVRLDYKGKLTNTYPKIDGDQWRVHTHPDGTLMLGVKQYKYLFWDGINGHVDWDWSKGFSVHKDDVDTFLEQKVETLGLNFAEAQDFITYWAPMIKQNEWTLVSFQTERYEELAKLMIDPKPDVLIRVFMVFKKSEGKIEILEQQLSTLERKGFTVVEWGGSNLDEINISD